MEKELKIEFPTYNEMSSRFDENLIKFQSLYNESKDQLNLVCQLRALRQENERIISEYKGQISDLGNTLNEAIERLKKNTFIHVISDENIPGTFPQSRFKGSGMKNSEEDNLLVSQLLNLQDNIIKGLTSFWYPKQYMINQLIEMYKRLNSRLIQKEKFSKPYFSLLERVFDLGKILQNRLQDIAVINFVLEKIIEEGNYISNTGKIELSKQIPVGYKGMRTRIKELKTEGDQLVLQKEDQTLKERHEEITYYLITEFPDEIKYPPQSTVRNWLDEK